MAISRKEEESGFNGVVHLKEVCDMSASTEFRGTFFVTNDGAFLMRKEPKKVLIPVTNVAYILVMD